MPFLTRSPRQKRASARENNQQNMPPNTPVFSHPRYVPGAELGRGAQGIVVRVTDREAPTLPLVAKVWQGRTFRDRALQGEYALLSRLRISGLVRAHDFGRCAETGAPFFVEGFAEGPEARVWVSEVADAAKGSRILLLLASLTSTIAQLHESGFLHGDLKPVHVRIASSGQTRIPMLLDLGAAVARAQAHAQGIAMTPAFAAPEILAGAQPSVATDLYSLGATIWAVVTGAPPLPSPRRTLFELSPWLPPNAAKLVDELLAEHPQDRPANARELLRRLGITGLSPALPAIPMGREKELNTLVHGVPAPVRWLVGPSGSGKTHLLRELQTRLLLDGRDVRLLRFPADGELIGKLLAYLRGDVAALPFRFGVEHRAKPLILLDDAHLAPDELHAAVDAYRCRSVSASFSLEFVVATRTAPRNGNTITLGPLEDRAFAQLCANFDVFSTGRIHELAVASGKNPGWLIASLGAIPLEKDTALERLRTLSSVAQDLLAAIVQSGGEIPESVCQHLVRPTSDGMDAMAELLATALITRRMTPEGHRYSLDHANLIQDLAPVLGTPERLAATLSAWVAETFVPTTTLIALGTALPPSLTRTEMLSRAAAQARSERVRTHEIEALLALVATKADRTVPHLLRLERLLRDGSGSAGHPQVLEWLDEAARHDAEVVPLVLRRRAEKLAREGKTEAATELAEQARRAAEQRGDRCSAALALATRGVAALYRADWEEAERCLEKARNELTQFVVTDTEEWARLDHNVGVIALYRGRVEEAISAFERALEAKRNLGDRAGMRSCLLNLGLALTKAKRWEEADRVLEESLRLACSLGQTTGQGWCLAARADVCIRRKDAAKAREWLADAWQLEASLPKPVQADLLLLEAEAGLLEGDGLGAEECLQKLDAEVRSSDALVDARALVLEARASLSLLPIAKNRAARTAIRAIRRARGAKLIEWETEALSVFRAARGTARHSVRPMQTISTSDSELWSWLAGLSAAESHEETATSLGRLILRHAGAERVFLAWIDEAGQMVDAYGVDFDGLPIALPMQRLAPEMVAQALRSTNPIVDRQVDLHGHLGCRLAIASMRRQKPGNRGLLVLEHRFISTAFDHITAELARRWVILVSLFWRTYLVQDERATGESETNSSRPRNIGQSSQTTYFPVAEKKRAFPTLVGQSRALERALARLESAIESELPTLIIGETGTGKELFARALHDEGKRRNESFVAFNCGAIPDSLFEAELFGHVRGSFTGAERARSGLLARAAKGTLFLDEIGELPLLRQATLLRVLQDRRYRPVGSDEEIAFDVRIVAATNRDLQQAVEQGTFRRDLLYRLNTLEIHVPPLRERHGDIPALTQLFLEQAGSQARLSTEAWAALEAYTWPGNVRELEHVMQRLALQRGELIELASLPRDIRGAVPNLAQTRHAKDTSGSAEEAARQEVQEALRRCRGNISQAASVLGLTRHGLKKRMVRLGLRAPAGAEKKEG